MAKSKRLDPKELITALVNKQLEPYNKTLEDVKQEKDWYEIYTCTPKQYDDWLTWGADFIYNNSKDPILKTSKKMCPYIPFKFLIRSLEMKNMSDQSL